MFAGGCLGSTDRGPCGEDSLMCAAGPPFAIDDACEASDPLLVTLGQGDGEFVALLRGGEVEVHRSLLGVEYLLLGVRIDNPLEDHLLFDVEVDLELVGDDGLWTDSVERHGVYDRTVARYDDGEVTILDIVVEPKLWLDAEDRRITLDVVDSCGRRADLLHVIDPELEAGSSSSSSG